MITKSAKGKHKLIVAKPSILAIKKAAADSKRAGIAMAIRKWSWVVQELGRVYDVRGVVDYALSSKTCALCLKYDQDSCNYACVGCPLAKAGDCCKKAESTYRIFDTTADSYYANARDEDTEQLYRGTLLEAAEDMLDKIKSLRRKRDNRK